MVLCLGCYREDEKIFNVLLFEKLNNNKIHRGIKKLEKGWTD